VVKSKLTNSLALVNLIGLMFCPMAMAAPTSPVQSQTHDLISGTYLGGSGDDQARGVGWTAAGEVIVGGNFANFAPTIRRAAVRTLLGATSTAPGQLLKLSPDGKTILATVALGQRIDDLKVLSTENRIVVGGDFGVVVLEASSLNVLWSSKLPGLTAGNGNVDGQQTRVAMEPSGRVAVLRASTVKLFSAQGAELASQKLTQTYPTDIAIDPFGRRLYVTGFSNRSNTGVPVQVPFLTAFATGDQPTLTPLWKTWDYDAALLRVIDPVTKKERNNDMADSRLYRLAIGGDGAVTVLGESAGGNSVFRWNGRNLTSSTLVKLDAYSDTYNSKSNHMLYYAKVEAASGAVLAGQYAVPRLGSGAANTFRAKEGSLAVGPTGTLYIGGVSAYGTPGRDANRFMVAGIAQAVAPYYGEDMVLLTVSADFKQRFRWTPLARSVAGGPACVKGLPIGPTSSCGGGTINALAVQGSNVALFGTVDLGGLMTPPDGLATQPFNPEDDQVHDAYLAIVKGP
jgi:hypothetical protein